MEKEFIIEDGVLKKYIGAGGDVEIPDGVKIIGEEAFHGCENLRHIKIPGSVKEILFYAFGNCKNMEEAELSKGIDTIGVWAFRGCESLKKIVIPEGVRRIGESAFFWCKNVKQVVIPKSLKEIEELAFYNLAPSCEIVFEELPPISQWIDMFDLKDETLRIWMKNDNISDVLPKWRKAIVRGFVPHYLAGDAMSEAAVKSTLQFMKTHIKDFLANRDCLRIILQEKLIPVGKIQTCAEEVAKLEDPELTAMILEYQHKNFPQESIERAADKALERKFKSLERELNRTEPTKKELEKTWSFQHSFAGEGGWGVTSYKGEERRIDVPEKFGKEKVTEIFECAFSPYPGYYSPKNQEARKAIEEIFLPVSVIRIRDLAFSSCSSLKRVHIPEQTTEIGIWAFSGNSPELTICAPEGSYAQRYVRERPVLGQGAIRFEKEGVVKKEQFRKYNGESPEFVIENGTLLRYMGTGIDVKVPDGVEVIGEGAFSGCGSLRSAELPETTRTIKANAFYGVHPDCEIVMKGSVLTGPEESENPWKDVLCIWAKKMEPSALPQELRKKAAKGFARHFAEAGEMPETVKTAYLQYMKKNCQKLWMDGDCLRVILQEKYITAGKIGVYLDEAGRLGKPELTKALLEYRDKNFSREALEREEQKTKGKVKDGPSAAELKKIWSTKKREDGTLIITRYKGTDLQVTVPKQIGKSLVTAISAFFSWMDSQVQNSITEIILPDSITLIEGSAFDYCGSHCDSLTSVHIPAKTVEFRGNPFSEIKNHLTIYAPKGSTAEQLVEEWQERYYTAEKNGWPHIDKSVQWIAFEPEEEGS